jgi:hypothetical protein
MTIFNQNHQQNERTNDLISKEDNQSKTTKNRRKQQQPKSTKLAKKAKKFESECSDDMTMTMLKTPSPPPLTCTMTSVSNADILPMSDTCLVNVITTDVNCMETITNCKKKNQNRPRTDSTRTGKAKSLPEEATQIMKQWYADHSDNPYPSEEERREMAQMGFINESQVKAWFANKRNRTNNTRPKNLKKIKKLPNGPSTPTVRSSYTKKKIKYECDNFYNISSTLLSPQISSYSTSPSTSSSSSSSSLSFQRSFLPITAKRKNGK